MTDEPEIYTAPPGGLHHIQVKLAFLTDQEHRARPAALTAVDGDTVTISYLDGAAETVVVNEPERLADVLARDDLCRIQGHPLLLVNTHYRVLGIATGLATPPSKLEVLIVSRLENGSVVELVNGDDTQPAWQTFALRSANHADVDGSSGMTGQVPPERRMPGAGPNRATS